MGISLISELEPKNSGSFALLDDKYLRGGLRVVETVDELSSIPTDRLKDGCLSMVTMPSRVLYVYDKNLDIWEPFSSGGGGGGSDWLCVEDGETTKFVKNVDTWTQVVTVINHIRTYSDYFALPTEYVQNNEVAYCKADVMEGTTTYKKGLYYYDLTKTSWVEVNSSIEIDSALSDTSKRPVQNRVVTKALDEKVSKDDVDNVISKYSENPVQNKAIAEALENVKAGKTLTEEEYEALDEETKNNDSFYYISDKGEIYQNGIMYGGGQTVELTYEEYKALEAAGEVEEDVDYIIVGDQTGILLTATDVVYDNTTTVKGAIDNINQKINETIGSNVPKTKIEFTNSTNWSIPNTNLETFYIVKNGWCFLHVVAHCNVVANDNNSIVYTGLPVPPFQVYGNFVGNDYTYNPCQLTVGTDGRMLLRGGTVGKDYSFTYTYPVAD